MALGEAITNIAAARVRGLESVRLSANWMAAAGAPGEDQALHEAVTALALELCPELGIAIPVGKDSLSMQTRWEAEGETRAVTSPLSLVVSAFAPVEDGTRTLTPELQLDEGATRLVLLDLGFGANRLGASSLAQAYGQLGHEVPDLADPARLKAFFALVQRWAAAGKCLPITTAATGASGPRRWRWPSRLGRASTSPCLRRTPWARSLAKSSAPCCRCGRTRCRGPRRGRSGGAGAGFPGAWPHHRGGAAGGARQRWGCALRALPG